MSHINRALLYKAIVSLLILGCMALVVSACRSDEGVKEVDQSTPEATVRAMYQALEQADPQLLESLIAPTDPSRKTMADAVKRMKSSGVTAEFINSEIHVISNDGQTALLSATGHSRLLKGKDVIWDDNGEGSSDYTLTQLDGKWYLVGLGQWPSPGFIKP
jgi:hypothetical protein